MNRINILYKVLKGARIFILIHLVRSLLLARCLILSRLSARLFSRDSDLFRLLFEDLSRSLARFRRTGDRLLDLDLPITFIYVFWKLYIDHYYNRFIKNSF